MSMGGGGMMSGMMGTLGTSGSLGGMEAMMGSMTQEMDQATMMSARMQVEQSLTSAVANVMKSGASNVKSASQGG
jgi:hypothetical protein